MTLRQTKFKAVIAKYIYFMKQFDFLGISRKYTGYYYLVEIVQYLVNQDVFITSFSKQIYPLVAQKFNTTECTIERNIRSLIDHVWTLEIMEKLNVYLPNRKPTCKEFIFMIKNYIINQIM